MGYSDIDLSFKPHPVTGDLVVRKDASAVMQSIRNIVMTRIGEVGFEEYFGTPLGTSLFQLMDPLAKQTIQNRITQAIQTFEPRADLDVVEVNFNQTSNDVEVFISFYVLNQEQPYSFVLTLERLR